MEDERPKTETDEKQSDEEQKDYSKEVSTVELLDNRVVIIPPSQWALLFALLAVVVFLGVWSVVGELTTRVQVWGMIGGEGSRLLSVDAPRYGIVRRLVVDAGSIVQEGDPLAEILELSSLSKHNFQFHTVHAPLTSKVTTLSTEEGRHVEKEGVLLRLRTSGKSLRGHLYLPVQDRQQVRQGQRTLLHATRTLTLAGKIVQVSGVPLHRRQIVARWGEGIVLPTGSIFYEIIFALDNPLPQDPAQRGFSWLLVDGQQLTMGMQKIFSITVKRYSPLSLVLPWLGEDK